MHHLSSGLILYSTSTKLLFFSFNLRCNTSNNFQIFISDCSLIMTWGVGKLDMCMCHIFRSPPPTRITPTLSFPTSEYAEIWLPPFPQKVISSLHVKAISVPHNPNTSKISVPLSNLPTPLGHNK